MVLQAMQKPTWRTGLMKRIRAIPLEQRYDMTVIAVLLLVQVSLVVFGIISASSFKFPKAGHTCPGVPCRDIDSNSGFLNALNRLFSENITPVPLFIPT